MTLSPFAELLGNIPPPTIAAGTDFRDANDAWVAAVAEAYRANPDRFFDVLDRQPALLTTSEVVSALGGIEDDRAIPLLLGVLRDGDATMRWSAAHGVAKRRSAQVASGLIAALRDRAPTVRAVVIEALGEQGDPRAIDSLREAAKKPSNRNDAYLSKLIDAALEALSSR